MIPLTVFLSNAPNRNRLSNIYNDRKGQEMDIMLYTVLVFLSVISSRQPGRVTFLSQDIFLQEIEFPSEKS